MRQLNVAIGMLACLLAGCADSTPTQLAPTSPQNVSIQLKPTLPPVVSSPGPCVTRVEWGGSGVAQVEHEVEVGTGQALATIVKPDKPPRTSTVSWDPITVGSRGATGRVQAILLDRKNNVLASTGWVDLGFVCGGG
jgi:hypothetical protein